MNAYKIIVKGKVQGVFYRKTIHDKAQTYGFNGYIKNLNNGDVEVGVMLDRRNYNNFLKILQDGSPYSKVKKMDVSPMDGYFNDFTIKH